MLAPNGQSSAERFEEALERIDRNTFGVCEVCNCPIAPARLDAVDASLPRLQGAARLSARTPARV